MLCAAVLAAASVGNAQDTIPRRGGAQARQPGDTTGRDSVTERRARVLTAADTLKAPLAAPYTPLAIAPPHRVAHWSRDALFAAGALTLAELIAQVPGVTLMATGFMMAPAALAWHGDPGGIRVFVDGIEREDVTPRNGGVTDFTLIPLWTLEDVALEETAGELRVHARTWRVDRTTPSTRTDVLTGSENLNLFRGFFGKRSSQGAALQLGAQQASTISAPGMDGDALGAFGRLGWAGGPWSVDATTIRQGINRNAGARGLLTTSPQKDALPAFQGSSSLSYLRAGWRDPGAAGAWLQAVVATVAAGEKPASTPLTGLPATADSTADSTASADTTASQLEYAVGAGLNRGSLRTSAHVRARSRDGVLDVAPLARLEFSRRTAMVSAAAGRRPGDATVWDIRGSLRPFEWLHLAATTGVSQASGGAGTRAGSTAELAVRVRDRWLSVGMRRLDPGAVAGPVELDTAAVGLVAPAGSALTFSAEGPVWRGWRASSDVVRWDAASAYRPQMQLRSRLWFASDFKERFPTANFHILAALTHEYRSLLFVPNGAADPVGQSAAAWSAYGSLLEIRISNAVLVWDYRNMAGRYLETFPGYLMPRITSVYGIRWQFWN